MGADVGGIEIEGDDIAGPDPEQLQRSEVHRAQCFVELADVSQRDPRSSSCA
jgi:hypothetical protein